ncbi:MAG TPA: MFS transporter [Actinomycetales bacterium]|nr:MFS transporter [Actinomycetales bacterium]
MTSQPGTQPATSPPAPTRSRWRRALRFDPNSLAFHHDFRQLWFGDAVSQLGVQLTMLALPVLAVRVLDATPFQMGLLTAFEMAAFLLVGLPAGAWVDRWRKKRVLMLGDAVRGALLLTLPAAYVLDMLTMTQLFLVAFGVGTATVFFDVAYQSYLPDLVPSERIAEGNAKLQAVQSVSQVAGPALGGGLIRLIGAPFTIASTAICMIASVTFVWRIRHTESPPARADRRPLRTEIAEGLSFVLKHPLLVRITACTALSNFFSAMTASLLVLYVLRVLGLNETVIGLVMSAGSVGGLIAAVVAARLALWIGEGRIIPLSILAGAPFAALAPLASVLPSIPALAVGSFGISFTVVVYNVTQVSFRQRVCPKPLLGRMNASVRCIVWGTMPLGGLVAGVLGSRLGVVPTLWVAAAGAAVAAAPVLFSPLIGMRQLPQGLDQHA